MRTLTAEQLLNVWERGRVLPPLERALLLLEAASSEEESSYLEHMPMGQRDQRLLLLRQVIFGQKIESMVTCPQCKQGLEFSILVDDLLTEAVFSAELA